MSEWFQRKDLVGLPGLPNNPRNINILAKTEGWQSQPRKGRGGGFEYHLSSLPEETQTALLIQENRKNPDDKPSGQSTSSGPLDPVSTASSQPGEHRHQADEVFKYDPEALWDRFARKTFKQKEKAQKLLDAINDAIALIEQGTQQTQAWEITAAEHGMHLNTLRDRAYKQCKKYHQSDWLAALVPGYIGRTAKAECDPAAFQFFMADFLRLERPTANACYERLKRAANEHNWKIPSVETLSRKIKKEIPRSTRVLKREGEQALMAMYPVQKRTVKEMHALEWINGDGYQHNVFVLWPNGDINRPKTWFWQDVYSRKILAYRVDITENTDVIRLSFGELVENFGIPDHVTIDNTRSAANKWMTGGVPNRYRFKIKEDDPLGLFPTLKIKVHWTSVHNGHGHGQAKPVERSFGIGGIGEVVDKHPAFAGAYTGNSPMAKPENYGSTAVPLDKFTEVLEQEIIAWNARDKRRTEMAAGNKSFDQVFTESYQRSSIRIPTEEQRRLWMLSAEAIRVQRDGTFTLDAGKATGKGRNRYQANSLHEHEGQKVVVRFDPQTLHKNVFVYTLDGRFIDEATCIDDSGFGDTLVGREFNRRRTQFMKHTKAAAEAELQMDAVDVANYLPNAEAPDQSHPKVTKMFVPAKRHIPKQNLNERDQAAVIQLRQEIEQPVTDNTFQIPHSDPDKHQVWLSLNNRVVSGEKLDEEESRFYDAWQNGYYYKAITEIENDLAIEG